MYLVLLVYVKQILAHDIFRSILGASTTSAVDRWHVRILTSNSNGYGCLAWRDSRGPFTGREALDSSSDRCINQVLLSGALGIRPGNNKGQDNVDPLQERGEAILVVVVDLDNADSLLFKVGVSSVLCAVMLTITNKLTAPTDGTYRAGKHGQLIAAFRNESVENFSSEV